MYAPLNNFNPPINPASENPHAYHGLHLNAAIQMFNRAMSKGWFERLWSFLMRRERWLVNLNETQLQVRSSCYTGLKTVSLTQICGTEGRSRDFDLHFHPRQARLRERWINVLMARYQGIGLPPVELIQIDECYFVRDGHHRLSVAAALGQETIDAEVTAWTIANRTSPFAVRNSPFAKRESSKANSEWRTA
jgi:hypothetical protein